MLIDLKDMCLSIGETSILKRVSLSVAAGEIYGLLGPNGAGKSTTINAALGLLPISSGTIRILGQDPQKNPLPIYQHVGIMPGNNGFYGWMSAESYLGFFSRLYRISLNETDIAKCLEQVGLRPRAGQSIATYSRGMRQRLGLARALLANPKLLILDEPANGLDPRGRREVHDILLDLSTNRNVGILLCTHLLDDVDRLCQRIGIIDEGKTIAEGGISELIRKDKHLARYRIRLDAPPPNNNWPFEKIKRTAKQGTWITVDLDPSLRPHEAWRQMLFAGWPVAEIAHEGGGLEELYMDLTEHPHSQTRRVA